MFGTTGRVHGPVRSFMPGLSPFDGGRDDETFDGADALFVIAAADYGVGLIVMGTQGRTGTLSGW